MTRRAVALAALLAAAGACGRGDIESPDPARRAAAVRSVSPRSDRALAVLLVAQRDASPLVRAAAAEAFAARGGPDAADALGKLLLDPVADVSIPAARGLAGMPGEPRAREQLVQGYAGATPAARAAIADALDRIGVSLREAIEAEARLLWDRNLAGLQARGAARMGAAEELGASGRADAVQRLLPLVDSRTKDRALAAGAARGLGESGEWSARQHLETLLADPDASLAEAAALALGRLGDPAAADALAAAGTSETGRIGAAAVDALAALPEAPEVGVALCDLALRAGDPTVAGRAAREARRRDADCPEKHLLAKLGRPGTAAAIEAVGELRLQGARAQAAVEKIAPLLERGPEAPVRIAAARALARLGGQVAQAAVLRRAQALEARLGERRTRWIATAAAPGAPAQWIDPVSADDAREAAAVLVAAGRLVAPGIEPLLLAHARDPRPELRAGAVEALGHLRSGAALDAVAGAMEDPDLAVRTAALDGLARAGARGTPILIRAAGAAGDSPEWRIALARALGETGAVEAIPAAAALLGGPSAAAAAAALARIGAPAAAAPLAAHLGRPEAAARPEAVEALSQIVARDAAPAIQALLTDDRPDVRAAAARALGRLRIESASQRLEALRSDYYGRVRRAAVEALSKLPSGVPRARR